MKSVQIPLPLLTMETQPELERYATPNRWAEILGIGLKTLQDRLQGIEAITGKDRVGHVLVNMFYAESQVRNACADILSLPRLDKYSFLILNKEKYGTAEAWAKEFGTVHADTLRINLSSSPKMMALSKRGIVASYAETIVRSVCSRLINCVPTADSSGFFTKDGERYGPTYGWARTLCVSNSSLNRRLQSHKNLGIRGKDCQGKVTLFFPESCVREVCGDLLVHIPAADVYGFFYQNEERHGTVEAWGRFFSVRAQTIKAITRRAGITGMDGKDAQGKLREKSFFAESAIRTLCCDLLDEIPVANKEGFLQVEDERYGTIEAWSRFLGTHLWVGSSQPVCHTRLGAAENFLSRRVHNREQGELW